MSVCGKVNQFRILPLLSYLGATLSDIESKPDIAHRLRQRDHYGQAKHHHEVHHKTDQSFPVIVSIRYLKQSSQYEGKQSRSGFDITSCVTIQQPRK